MTETEYATYEIETLDDFYKIPEDRLDAFLAEFRTYLSQTRELNKTLGEIRAEVESRPGTAPGQLFGNHFTKFVWKDDGKNDQTIRFNVNTEVKKTNESS